VTPESRKINTSMVASFILSQACNVAICSGFWTPAITRRSAGSARRRPKKRQCTKSREVCTRQCSERYGDRMLVAISMVDAARARGDVHARMQVYRIHQRAVRELMGGIGSRGGVLTLRPSLSSRPATGHRPLGSCSRAAGWSAATSCVDPDRT
jgi:hypothetical protein